MKHLSSLAAKEISFFLNLNLCKNSAGTFMGIKSL
jgi:hypothetical protein